MGLIGYGDLAKGVEQLARAFGMEVIVTERKGAAARRSGRVSFEDLLKSSDVISLHAPLNDQTRNMIGLSAEEVIRNIEAFAAGKSRNIIV